MHIFMLFISRQRQEFVSAAFGRIFLKRGYEKTIMRQNFTPFENSPV